MDKRIAITVTIVGALVCWNLVHSASTMIQTGVQSLKPAAPPIEIQYQAPAIAETPSDKLLAKLK